MAARAGRVPVLLAEEEGDRGGSGGGLGRQLELGHVSPSALFIFFCFVLFNFVLPLF